MQDGLGILPAPRILAGLRLQQCLVPRHGKHLEPRVRWLRDDVAGVIPKNAVTGFLARVVQDVAARSFERRPAFVEAGDHCWLASF